MIQVEHLMQRPQTFEALCGLKPAEFTALVERIEPLWDQRRQALRLWEGRQRRIGAGRKFKLDVAHRLLLTLIYLRHRLPRHLLGIMFELNAANISRNIRAFLPLLEQELSEQMRGRILGNNSTGPDLKVRQLRTIEEAIEAFPEITGALIIKSN